MLKIFFFVNRIRIKQRNKYFSGGQSGRRRFDTSAVGGIFLRASHRVRRRSAAIPRPGAWQKPKGDPLDILPKTHTHVYRPTQSKTYSSHPTPDGLYVAAGYQIKKKQKKRFSRIPLKFCATFGQRACTDSPSLEFT